MRQVLPSGVLGLAYASIFAVVMSTVDSLIVAGTATLSCDILPAFRRSESSLTGLRIFAVLIGAAALGIAYIFPSIVQLSVIAAFTSLCFAPAMLVGLFNWKVSPNAVFVSMILALIALFLGQSTLGNLNFIAIIAAGCLPILFDLARSGLRLRASPPQA
jgi:Na+/proline symporter